MTHKNGSDLEIYCFRNQIVSTLEANGQLSYIKPANYEISKTRKYKNDIGKIENMEYDVKKDIYTCRNGKKLGVDHIRHSKSKTGYAVP